MASSNASARPFAVLGALREELGELEARVTRRETRQGIELAHVEDLAAPLVCCVTGIGKVRAAHAASVAIGAGARALLVVGTCGGLRRALVPGTLVHCEAAMQSDLRVADLGVRDGRHVRADEALLAAWRAVAPGALGAFLTADRAVLSWWRRRAALRAWPLACAADMETAAVAAVAERARVPWAALRAVTDGAGRGAIASFRAHYPTQAGRAADTVGALVEHLARAAVARREGPG